VLADVIHRAQVDVVTYRSFVYNVDEVDEGTPRYLFDETDRVGCYVLNKAYYSS